MLTSTHDVSKNSTLGVREGTSLQAGAISSDQNQTPANPTLTSYLGVSGPGNLQASVRTAPNAIAQGSQPLVTVGALSTPTYDPNFRPGQRCDDLSRPSRLNQQYSTDNLNDLGMSKLRDHDDPNTQHFQHNLTNHSIPGPNYYSWLSDLRNTMFSRGYHKESYERTRLSRLENNATSRQSGSNSSPASPIGPYKTPLSSSTPATCTVDPRSLSHPIPSTSTTTNPPCSIPIATTPSLSASSYLTHSLPSPAQAVPQQQRSLQLTLGGQNQDQFASHNITSTPHSTQMLATLGTSAQDDQPPSPILQSIQQSIQGNNSGPKKRSRAVNPTPTNSTIDALAADPEGFKVSAKSAFTRKDYDDINILVAAMNDMTSTEDNDGMIKSWNKLRIKKAAKVTRVCEDLLVRIWRMHLTQDSLD